MLRAFPGAFPPSEFNAMTLDEYAETYGLAVDFLERDAEARRR
jgi:hypothetical protein